MFVGRVLAGLREHGLAIDGGSLRGQRRKRGGHFVQDNFPAARRAAAVDDAGKIRRRGTNGKVVEIKFDLRAENGTGQQKTNPKNKSLHRRAA